MAQSGTPKRDTKAIAGVRDFPSLSPSNHRNASGRWFELRESLGERLVTIATEFFPTYSDALKEAERLISEFPFKEISIIACDLVRVVDNPATRTTGNE